MTAIYPVPPKPQRRRRVQLAVPASERNKIEKSMGLEADHIFLDLEDAVAPQNKEKARHNIVAALNEADWGDTVRCFRMNGLDTHWAYDDLITVVEAAGHNLDTVMLPKARYARDVEWLDIFLGQIEAKKNIAHRIGIEVLIEEVEGVANVDDIALASPRVESLIFGIGDYTRAQRVDPRDAFGQARHYPGDIWHYQRSRIAVAAGLAGADYIDGPWALIDDLEGFRRECRLVKTLGGVGKWALHPNQVAIATEEFSPSLEEIKQAQSYIDQFERAKAQGVGAVKADDGQMLDEATLALYRRILESADFFGISY